MNRLKLKRLVKPPLAKLGLCTKPGFIIIGAQKCGTTGLFNILNQHSKLTGSDKKEVHYFDNDKLFNPKKYWEYHSYFPLHLFSSSTSVQFEATPVYVYHPKVAKRLYEYNPKLKLILSLRNPAYRAFSAWTMYHFHFESGRNSRLYEPRGFDEVIMEELQNLNKKSYYDNKVAYINRGIYHKQIKIFLEYFKREQLLILEDKEILSFNESTSRKIQSFIGVDYETLRPIKKNTSKINMKENYLETIQNLKEFFEPHNHILFRLINEEYEWD